MLYCVYIYQTKNIYTNRVACNLHFKYSVPVYLLIHKKFIATLIFCTITASALDAILLIFYVDLADILFFLYPEEAFLMASFAIAALHL